MKKSLSLFFVFASVCTFAASTLFFTPQQMVLKSRIDARLLETSYLKQFISISGSSVKISHSGTGVEMFCGGTFKSGRQLFSFQAKCMGNEAVKVDVAITMYPMHFDRDMCTGKAGSSVAKKSFAISGNSFLQYNFYFDVTPEMLQCALDEHLLPGNRFFIRITHSGRTNQEFEMKNVCLQTTGDFGVWGKREISGAEWLEDALLKDALVRRKNAPDAPPVKDAKFLKKSTEYKTKHQKLPEEEKSPVLSLKKIVSSIQCDMPALLRAEFKGDRIFVDAMPTGGEPFVDIYLNLPDKDKTYYLLCSNSHKSFSIVCYAENLRCSGSSWYSGKFLKLEKGCVKVRIKSCYFKENKTFTIEKITDKKEF